MVEGLGSKPWSSVSNVSERVTISERVTKKRMIRFSHVESMADLAKGQWL